MNFLFDFDGTLVDSSPLHDRAFRYAIAERCPHLLAGYDYRMVQGKTTSDAFATLGVLRDADVAALTAEKQRRYRAAVAEGQLRAMPGAHLLLRDLLGLGHDLYLVSSASSASLTAGLRSAALTEFFSGIICGEDVRWGKPAPDSYLRCLNRFALPIDACIAIEDSESGFAAARRAGLPVIAIHATAPDAAVDLSFPTLIDLHRWALNICRGIDKEA